MSYQATKASSWHHKFIIFFLFSLYICCNFRFSTNDNVQSASEVVQPTTHDNTVATVYMVHYPATKRCVCWSGLDSVPHRRWSLLTVLAVVVGNTTFDPDCTVCCCWFPVFVYHIIYFVNFK